MSAWVRCSIEHGMLPSEYAVEMDTLGVGRISLFPPELPKGLFDHSSLSVPVKFQYTLRLSRDIRRVAFHHFSRYGSCFNGETGERYVNS